MASSSDITIAVIIPCYKVKKHILDVINKIGPECQQIFVVDDQCPEHTGTFVSDNCQDSRVQVIHHETNLGVGGATLTGFQQALEHGADILIKLDGDGQMDPSLIPLFTFPIEASLADYVKGNRFFHIRNVKQMPLTRLIGNAILSFITKFSTGYWHLFDPNNGYVAIHANVADALPFNQISKRYFFESDLLYHLNLLQAVVTEIPMQAIYENEESNLSVQKVMFPFLFLHFVNFGKRIFYKYFIRNFNTASIQLVLGLLLLGFGVTFGTIEWIASEITRQDASAGTVMLGALPIILGVQFLLGFLNFDMAESYTIPLHKKIKGKRKAAPRRAGL